MTKKLRVICFSFTDSPNGKSKTAASPPADTPPEGQGTEELMTRDTLSRLLGAVSFGYGMFQLGLSMIPDKVLKLIEFLGFHADRESGLKALGISLLSISSISGMCAVVCLLASSTVLNKK